MFEEMTYELLLEKMLGKVTNGVDKTEGSLIHNAIAPAAYELFQAYFNLDNCIDMLFVGTAVGEYLDKKALDYGITRKRATYAERKIETTGEVEIGTRWGLKDATYIIAKLLSENVYSARCEQQGEIGNLYSGQLENINYVNEVKATLKDVIAYGEEEEKDDGLRERIQRHLANPSKDGNAAQYLKWATEFDGVGRAKIFPLWNGGNTVKVAITNSQYTVASSELIDAFQVYLDSGAAGLGNGVAPIGSKVTVSSGTPKGINISANVVLTAGYTEPEGASDAILDYLASVTYLKNSISYIRIGSVLLDCASIQDVSGLSVNSGAIDIPLTGDEIPALTGVSLVVIPS